MKIHFLVSESFISYLSIRDDAACVIADVVMDQRL